MGSIQGFVIPKTLKMVPVASFLGAQHDKISTGLYVDKSSAGLNKGKQPIGV